MTFCRRGRAQIDEELQRSLENLHRATQTEFQRAGQLDRHLVDKESFADGARRTVVQSVYKRHRNAFQGLRIVQSAIN